MVVNAQVVVTLPDGCQWSVSDPDDGYTNVTDYIGGPDGITFFNGTGFMGLSLDENDDSGLGHHGVNKGVPALNGTTDFDDSGDDDAGDAGSDTENDSQDSVYAGTDLDKAFKTIYENKWYWPPVVPTGSLLSDVYCMVTLPPTVPSTLTYRSGSSGALSESIDGQYHLFS